MEVTVDIEEEQKQDAEPEGQKSWWQRLKNPGKQVFWVWVAYQAVKGTLTTSLIWIPLILAWWHHTH